MADEQRAPGGHDQREAGYDRREAGAFARELVGHLSSAMAVTGLELARRTGLLEAARTPRTPDAIAAAADLDPRYTRELVELLVVAGVLDHDPVAGEVVLPPARAAALLDPGPYDLSGMITLAAAGGAQLDDLERVVRDGGGIAYADLAVDPDAVIHRLTAGRYEALLVGAYLPQVPGLVDRLTRGAAVVELGCGRGRAATLIAEAFPASTVTGVDVSAAAVADATADAEARGIANARFVVGDAAAPPVDRADVVLALDVVHDLARPDAALRAARGLLDDDGLLVLIDSGAPPTLAERAQLPWAPMMYGVSLTHCLTVSLAQGGAGLGTMWGREAALAALDEAGFGAVETFELKGDPMDLLYAARPA